MDVRATPITAAMAALTAAAAAAAGGECERGVSVHSVCYTCIRAAPRVSLISVPIPPSVCAVQAVVVMAEVGVARRLRRKQRKVRAGSVCVCYVCVRTAGVSDCVHACVMCRCHATHC